MLYINAAGVSVYGCVPVFEHASFHRLKKVAVSLKKLKFTQKLQYTINSNQNGGFSMSSPIIVADLYLYTGIFEYRRNYSCTEA